MCGQFKAFLACSSNIPDREIQKMKSLTDMKENADLPPAILFHPNRVSVHITLITEHLLSSHTYSPHHHRDPQSYASPRRKTCIDCTDFMYTYCNCYTAQVFVFRRINSTIRDVRPR